MIIGHMKLIKRANSPYYYVQFERGKKKSLKTKSKTEAERLFKRLQKKAIDGKLELLDKTERISLKRLIKLFAEDPDRVNLSEDTHRADNLALRTLGEIVGMNCPIKLINDHSIKNLKKMLLERNAKPKTTDEEKAQEAKKLSIPTINTYLRHIKAALNFAYDNKLMEKKPPKIKFLKVPKRIPRIFTKDELDRILAHTKESEFEMWRYMVFALWTATRRQEILSARHEKYKNDKIAVIGKGDKERSIDVLPDAAEAIGDKKDIGPIFKQWHPDTISKKFKKHARACGIHGVKFHTLRHTSATFMLKSGIKLEVVQEILGHEDIRTTQIYAQVLDEIKTIEMQKLTFS